MPFLCLRRYSQTGEFEAKNVPFQTCRATDDDAARLVKAGACASPIGLSMTKLPRIKPGFAYNRVRFTAIVCLMAANFFFAVFSVVNHRYPIGVAAVLFLTPCLLRKLDLRSGRQLRRLGSFEWSCFIAAFLFLGVLPFLML